MYTPYVENIRKINKYILDINDVFKYDPLIDVSGDQIFNGVITYSNSNGLVKMVIDDAIRFFINDEEILAMDRPEDVDEYPAKYMKKVFIRHTNTLLNKKDLDEEVRNNLKKLQDELISGTLHYNNLINILNEGVDAQLVYDMEGYAKSENNTFSIFTNSNVIEISYKSSIIHKLTSVEQLDTLVEDVKKGMIEYSKKQSKYHASKLKEYEEMHNFYKKSLALKS